MPKPYFDSPLPHRLAHRGATLGGKFDENTWLAFAAALGQGASHIETDVQVTSDGVAVLFHDDDLLRVGATPLLPGKYLVSDYSLQEISNLKLACGGHISSLEATLKEFPGTRFNLDVKSASGVGPVAAVINAQQAHDRVLISSFSDKRRKATLALLDKPVATGAGSSLMLRSWLSVIARRFFGATLSRALLRATLNGVDAVQIPMRSGFLSFDKPDFVAAVRALGVEVHFWVINDAQTAERLLALGATGIVSDDLPALKH